MTNEILNKAELALIDKIVGSLGLSAFRSTLWSKVKRAFGLTFHGTNLEYGFVHATPDQLALDYLEERVFILSDKTRDRLTGNLRWELLEGMRNTESVDEIKRRLSKIFVRMEDYELERIARTETLNAMNAGRLNAYEKSGVAEYKMWRAAINNKRTAADSKRLHGQIQLLGDPFVDTKTGDECMHPPNRPNCRCAMIPLRKLPENVVRKGGQMYDADEMVGKIEINVGSLIKGEKRIWIKATSKRKGHYRKVKGAKKVEEIKVPKVSDMVPNNVEKIITLNDMDAKGGYHQVNSTIIKFKDGSHAMYKTIDKMSIFGEVATYNISNIVDWDIVPETVSGDFGNGNGSVQKWVEGGSHPEYYYGEIGSNLIKEEHLDDLSKIFVLDMVNGNYDRRQANIVIKGDRSYMIDNEYIGDKREGESACVALDEWSKGSGGTESKMLSWMKYIPVYEIPIHDFRDKFNKKVLDNIRTILGKRSEIIDYYTKNMPISEEGSEALNNIKENFDYMERYIKMVGEAS